MVAHAARLDGAARGVRPRIEVEDDPLAPEVGQLHGLAVLVRELEVGGGGAGFDHRGDRIGRATRRTRSAARRGAQHDLDSNVRLSARRAADTGGCADAAKGHTAAPGVGALGQAVFVGVVDGLSPVAGAGLVEDPVDVGLDGAALTNRPCSISAFESPAAISFSTSASRGVSSSGKADASAGAGSVPAAGRVEQLRRRCTGGRGGLSGDGRSDRLLDLLRARVLGQVAVGAGLECGRRQIVVGVGGEHQHPCVGERARISRVASAPSMRGIRRSISTIRAAVRGAARPPRGRRAAVPTTSIPSSSPISIVRPSRTTRWSSATDPTRSRGYLELDPPALAVGPADIVPPARSIRSRIPLSPWPPPTPARGSPGGAPLSTDSVVRSGS